LAVNSLLGPFVADRIDYPVSETMYNQTIGLDAATLLVVAPASVIIGALILQRHRAGPILALAPTGYSAYMFVQFIAGPDHLVYPRVLMLQLVIFAASWLLLAEAWRRACGSARTVPLERWHGYAALALAGFVLLRYVPGLVGSLSNEPLPAEVATDPAMYWLIVLLDLGVYVPLAVISGLGLIRARPWASLLHQGLIGWFLLVTVAVAAMAATMNLNDDPNASMAQLVLFIVVGVVVTAYAAVVFRPLLTREPVVVSPDNEAAKEPVVSATQAKTGNGRAFGRCTNGRTADG